MPRFMLMTALTALGLLVLPMTVHGDPNDLLQQAVEEDNRVGRPDSASTSPVDESAESVLAQADRLAEQQQFDQAIGLYEKAYRLDPANQSNFVRLLIAKQTAGRMTEEDRQALELLTQQQEAEQQQTFRRVRLNLIQIQQAVRADDAPLALQLVHVARAELNSLPASVDASPYHTELNRLDQAARRKHLKDQHARQPAAARVPETDVPAADAAAQTATADASLTLNEIGEAMDPLDDGQLFDVESALAAEQDDLAYQRGVDRALGRERAATLLRNREVGDAPPSDLAFPRDWPEKSARRASQGDWIIYRGSSRTGPDGLEYYTAVYNLGDLVHPVPNFYASYPGTVGEQREEALDRQYLRMRSQVFGGYASDLAAGLPLLQFFGGIDTNAYSYRADPQEMDRVLATIDAFLQSQAGLAAP